ncbi:MBL fold metallo-hydrolase [Haloechinothrix sp. LS1_15]|nr:MBL fold metallo-hydrolase [Haloechinothrix sp. LS1_15]
MSTVAQLDARRPVRSLVDTHHHTDHTFGNYVVPGHGPVGGAEQIVAVHRYLKFLGEVAESAHQRRLSPLEAAGELDFAVPQVLPPHIGSKRSTLPPAVVASYRVCTRIDRYGTYGAGVTGICP